MNTASNLRGLKDKSPPQSSNNLYKQGYPGKGEESRFGRRGQTYLSTPLFFYSQERAQVGKRLINMSIWQHNDRCATPPLYWYRA